MEMVISLLDLKRLESYSNNLIDFYLIRDLIPAVSRLFFFKQLDEKVRLSFSQCATLLGFGLQFREIEDVAKELNMEVGHCLALFTKTVKKISKSIRETFEREVRDEFAAREAKALKPALNPIKTSNSRALESEGKEVIRKLQTDSNLVKRAKEKEGGNLQKKLKKGGLREDLAVELNVADIDPAVIQKGSFSIVKKL
jgi:N-acetyltransferase 10